MRSRSRAARSLSRSLSRALSSAVSRWPPARGESAPAHVPGSGAHPLPPTASANSAAMRSGEQDDRASDIFSVGTSKYVR
jgi:hypothetical protein